MARKFANENFRENKNLTPEQAKFDEIWSRMEKIQRGKVDMPFAAIAFKPAVKRGHQAERGSVVPFGPNRLVVPADEVTVVLLNRIPTDHWRGAKQNRAFRLNLAEVPFHVSPHDGEVHAAASELPADMQRRIYQVDLSMNPRQDGQMFDEHSWSPDQLIPQPPELCAAHGGQFELRRDAMYADLAVNGTVYFRVPLEHIENVEIVAENLSVVENGAVLARCTGPVVYGQAVLDEYGKAKFDRVGPPIISATRKVHTLRMALTMLDRMVQAACLDRDDPQRPEVPPVRNWAPYQLVEFGIDEFGRIRDMDNWKESLELRSDIRKGVEPGGDFYVLSPVPAEVEFVRCEDPRHGVKDLVFKDGEGDEIRIEVPACAEILDSVMTGKIAHLSPVANYVPRKHYASWEEVKAELGEAWPFVVDAFLQHVAVWSHEISRDDCEVLVPAQYVKSVLGGAEPRRAWVDFRAAREYLNKEDGTIVPPPVSQSEWRDMLMSINGIGYDMTPTGDRITQSPIRERTRQNYRAAT